MKNLNVKTRFLSLATALTLMTTPVIGSAESNEVEETNEFALVQQIKATEPLTIEEYALGVKNTCEAFSSIAYDGMQADAQCLYFLVNRDLVSPELEQELIEKGYIFETNFDEGKYETFIHAYNLINVLNDSIQSRVRKTNNFSDMVDISVLCYDENDARLVRNMYMNYFNAYHNGMVENDDYNLVFKQLTTLNAEEQAGNGYELSTGANWLSRNLVGGAVMQLLRDYMQETYPRSELDKYFDPAQLNAQQWILRDDFSLDLNCLEGLQSEVFDFAELWVIVYDTVNNNLMKTFQIDCANIK